MVLCRLIEFQDGLVNRLTIECRGGTDTGNTVAFVVWLWQQSTSFVTTPRDNELAAPVDSQRGRFCLCSSVACRVHISLPGKAQLSAELSAFVRQIGFGVSADFWHCPIKLLKLKEMRGI